MTKEKELKLELSFKCTTFCSLALALARTGDQIDDFLPSSVDFDELIFKWELGDFGERSCSRIVTVQHSNVMH